MKPFNVKVKMTVTPQVITEEETRFNINVILAAGNSVFQFDMTTCDPVYQVPQDAIGRFESMNGFESGCLIDRIIYIRQEDTPRAHYKLGDSYAFECELYDIVSMTSVFYDGKGAVNGIYLIDSDGGNYIIPLIMNKELHYVLDHQLRDTMKDIRNSDTSIYSWIYHGNSDTSMSLDEAVDLLKQERDSAVLDISEGEPDQDAKRFVDAVTVVLKELEIEE